MEPGRQHNHSCKTSLGLHGIAGSFKCGIHGDTLSYLPVFSHSNFFICLSRNRSFGLHHTFSSFPTLDLISVTLSLSLSLRQICYRYRYRYRYSYTCVYSGFWKGLKWILESQWKYKNFKHLKFFFIVHSLSFFLQFHPCVITHNVSLGSILLSLLRSCPFPAHTSVDRNNSCYLSSNYYVQGPQHFTYILLYNIIPF